MPRILSESEIEECRAIVNELRAADAAGDLTLFWRLLNDPRLSLLRAFPEEYALIMAIRNMWVGYLDK